MPGPRLRRRGRVFVWLENASVRPPVLPASVGTLAGREEIQNKKDGRDADRVSRDLSRHDYADDRARGGRSGQGESLVEYLIGAGVHGLIPLGSTGEFYALTPQEQRDVLATVVAPRRPASR